jgi:hypothetical protein
MNQIQMKQNLQRAPLDSPCMMKVHKMRSAVTALTELFDAGTEHHVSADCLSDLGVIHKSKGVNMQNWMCHYIPPCSEKCQEFQNQHHLHLALLNGFGTCEMVSLTL